MFGPSSFHRDPFCHLPIPSAFSYVDYIAPPHMNYPRARQNRHVAPQPPTPLDRHRDHQPHRRRSYPDHYPSSSPSERDYTAEDTYYTSSSETNFSSPPPPPQVAHASSRYRKNKGDGDVVVPVFQHRTFAVPPTTLANLPPSPSSPTVLLLPQTLALTPLSIRLTTSSSTSTSPSTTTATTTLHAMVAAEMRFRDVVKQLVSPGVKGGDVRAYVRVRGEWQGPGGRLRVSEVVGGGGRSVLNGMGEVEVWIEVEGRDGRNGRRKEQGGGDGIRGWKTERGRMWEYSG